MFLNSIHSIISLLSVFFPIIAASHSDNDPLKNYCYWIIVDLQYCVRFVVQQSESLNIHIYSLFFFFLDSFPIQVITEYWKGFPVLVNRFFKIICFICISVSMSNLISKFIPPRPFPTGNHVFVFYICDSNSAL